MHLVIDSNQLQTDNLRQFLLRSKLNKAVITDFLGIEGYSGDHRGDFRWMEVLSDFPDRVVVLKGSQMAMAQSGRPSGLLRRLVDDETTRRFPQHVVAIRAAKKGDRHVIEQVESNRKYAVEHLAHMEKEAEQIRPAMEVLGRMYTKEERAIIRERKPYTDAMVDKLTKNLFGIVVMMVGPSARGRSFERDIKNTLAFRVALAMYVLTLHRTAASSVTAMKPSRLRNDMVDMILVAYGTFFDGVMTADYGLKEVYEEVCELLFGLYDAFIVRGHDPLSQSTMYRQSW
jgi:hypothetical protein